MERKTQGGVISRTKEMLRYRFCLRWIFLGGWGEIKQDLNTFTAPFPPHFPVNLLLSWYLSEDIFSFGFSSSPPPTPPSYQAFEGKHVSMGEQNEPFHETFCYGQKGREI